MAVRTISQYPSSSVGPLEQAVLSFKLEVCMGRFWDKNRTQTDQFGFWVLEPVDFSF